MNKSLIFQTGDGDGMILAGMAALSRPMRRESIGTTETIFLGGLRSRANGPLHSFSSGKVIAGDAASGEKTSRPAKDGSPVRGEIVVAPSAQFLFSAPSERHIPGMCVRQVLGNRPPQPSGAYWQSNATRISSWKSGKYHGFPVGKLAFADPSRLRPNGP